MTQTWAQRSAAYKAHHAARAKDRGRDIGRKRNGKKRGAHKKHPTVFLAVDGEGVTRADGQHDYVTLQASDGTAVERWERDGLSTVQCFEYLLDLHGRHPHATLVAFAFGYDANMILRDVSRAELERLAGGEYTMVGGRYLVQFLAGKLFYVGRGHLERGTWVTETGVTVWDTWGFFQSSFVAALNAWKVCAPETIEVIARMKERRGDFDDDMRALIVSYCHRECELLVRLMGAFKAVSDAAGITLQRWDGAGACAAALLRQRGAKSYIHGSAVTPDSVERAALYAYLGGRIEIMGSGVVPGEAYEYDINSAYPAEIAALPSMVGVWRRELHPHDVSDNGLYHVRWHLPDDSPVLMAPFPWRATTGEVLYQLRGEGYYHGVEVAAAVSVYGDAIDVLDGYVWEPESDEEPWAWVRELYELRRAYKEAGDARHIVLKLALNAMYGKLAQSIGRRNKRPAYQSYYLAGRVTAGTRAKMLRAGAQAGHAAISCMTDALFTRERIPELEVNNALGGWSEKALEPGLLVVQPGVVLSPQRDCAGCAGAGCYRCAAGRTMGFGRSRGFAREALSYDSALRAWQASGMFGAFSIVERRFIGMGRALAADILYEWSLGDPPERDLLGNLIGTQWRRWVEIEKSISFRANTQRKATWKNLYPDWVSWWPDEGEETLSEIYHPRTRYRTLDNLTAADQAENDGYRGVGIGT